MNVWCVFPTANPELAKRAIERWHKQGYKVATLRDQNCLVKIESDFPFVVYGYEGYWVSVNQLVQSVGLQNNLFVAAADDIDPDPNHTAQEIAAMYLAKFPDGFGLLQPIGDRQGGGTPEAPDTWNSARICGSPWFGRGWIERANQGKGPMPTGYANFYGDEFLWNSAKKQGVLWLNESLIQDHHHWSFGRRPRAWYNEKNEKSSQADYDQFLKDKADNFARGDALPK